MTCQDRLASDFCDAFNNELRLLGCGLHVAVAQAPGRQVILLLAADGSELGWVPDNVDAPIIAAFEPILRKVAQPQT